MNTAFPAIEFNAELLNKYNQGIPRYTSYPPATELTPEFDLSDFRAAINLGNYKKTPLSLYCHIPFCAKACYFCGCNTIITQHKPAVDPYLKAVEKQIAMVAPLLDKHRPVQQLHWGGGTPNYLSLEQAEFLFTTITNAFPLAENAEVSIEVNPCYIDRDYIFALRQLGFNRISFGIQDFNHQVQEAVNRIQPEAMLFEVMNWIREANFDSVNVDLIYGLPHQNLVTFRETLRKTAQLNPDRIAVFNFAYVPWLKPVQKKMPEAALPPAAEKLKIMQATITDLTEQGYFFIGMDHFAKPNDELAIAQQQGELHRNFQGYTTQPESDLLGFGITSISMLQDVYAQNHKTLKSFYNALDRQEIPIEKGFKLSQDDLIRRTVIKELMCQFKLSAQELEDKYNLGFDCDFNDYFAKELTALDVLEADGLLRRLGDGLEVTPRGRILIRNIAAVFDTYLQSKQQQQMFSKAI
ncbi:MULTISPECIES: oxygen-independent coproporphyrinogen III oxidase [unclassified Synechocystis]|uniref:oxygen-independent coproporphyrinogen III oxidase n=1 Tax=unclassified Synechocystis TaxID=2640012 RepID=UPI0004020499|nr:MULTISPECIES: oxygen-independent coproporphyrinogen III oxidase [unclassified Synechocystis]AIE73356.1 Coproporphyrinogen III oxidase, oxygen-independent [Synechocystis sp. PCC 6714]MCT0253170.1 oxygen-independent coproporphyrinogen III oxidase [Synechocystis sp. CS-94]